MQIELAPEVEARLAEEASNLGLTPTQLSSAVLTRHVARTSPLQRAADSDRDKMIEDFIARMKERSPGWETRDPYAVDWQAIKAEGRKY